MDLVFYMTIAGVKVGYRRTQRTLLHIEEMAASDRTFFTTIPTANAAQTRQKTALVGYSTISLDEDDPHEAIGVTERKHCVDSLDVFAFTVSLTCCILAILSVARDDIAWRLTVTNQVTVVGFLLSIMNLCLGRVISFFFLLLECRFGRSKLQNYDGILLNQVLKPRLDNIWRTVLLATLALPIASSVAYKRFQLGGTSSYTIDATSITGQPALYGMFSVPHINTLRGNNMALSLYFNATLPFRVASSPPIGQNGPGPEPPLSEVFPQVYGANTMLLSKESTVMLDMPQNTRLMALQNWLYDGESLAISASVHGSVTVHNTTIAAKDDPEFASACFDGRMALVSLDLFQGHSVYLLSPASTADQSHIWVGFVPHSAEARLPGQPKANVTDRCTWFSNYAKRYDTSRQECQGSWSVTRGGIQLTSGACNDTKLPRMQQYIFAMNTFFLGNSWLPVLAESIGLYASQRNTSVWLDPAMTTTIATMLWSSAVGLNGPGNRLNQSTTRIYGKLENRNVTLQEAGILYPLSETITSTRPTLVKSIWLYVVLAVQPLLTLAAMLASMLMVSTPIDRNFGLIPILAGVERNSLGVLRGAELSGVLRGDARLGIEGVEPGGSVKYTISSAKEGGGF